MRPPLNILVITESEGAFREIAAHLGEQQIEKRCECARTLEALRDAIVAREWDVILVAGEQSPIACGRILNERRAPNDDTPVIYIGECQTAERAIQLMTGGFADVVSSGNMQRLVAAIQRSQDERLSKRRHEMEVATLRQNEKAFRAMFDLASIGICEANARTGRFVRANQKMCSITGYSVEELLGLNIRDITHPEDRERDWQAFKQVVAGEASEYRVETRYVRKDGSIGWVNLGMTRMRDADGTPFRTMATVEDVRVDP
jgi:PAS domain S-box-containing protein